MHAGLELEARIGAMTDDAQDDFLEAAVFPLAGADHLGLPAAAGGILAVHAEQIAGEQGGLVTAGAGANLQENVGFVARIAGQQQ